MIIDKNMCSCETKELNPLPPLEEIQAAPNQRKVEKGPYIGDVPPLDAKKLVSSKTHPLYSLILEPFQWLQMLSSQLNPTFILGIFLVYCLNHGFSESFFKVVSDYYWKDVQKVQPSQVQLYLGLYYIPWVMKPVWGLLTDVFPVRGYRRRPYFLLAGVLGAVSAAAVALGGKLAAAVAVICFIGVAAGVAISNVTIDSCIARNSIEVKSLAADMQSLCGFCASAGALLGFSTSGFFVHHLGPQGALGLLGIPPALLIVLGFVIYEQRISHVSSQKTTEVQKLGAAIESLLKTMKFPQVWKPTVYIYLSIALGISTHEGQFYWYTDPKAGPAVSQELIGMVYAIGATASMIGVLIYHKYLKDYPFRNLVFVTQLHFAISGMLDVVFIFRLNLILGIPDSLFIIADESISRIVTKIRWMPMFVLSTRLCPMGIEGTFFALLMCIDSLGLLSSKWGGGMILHLLHVTRNDFTNLWLAILIRNGLRFATLAFIFLVPDAGYMDTMVPPDLLKETTITSENEESLQLVSLNENIEV